jgi:hypothetical protein
LRWDGGAATLAFVSPFPTSSEGIQMKRLRSKLTYANVVSTLCLFLLLGGTAYATLSLPKNSVGSKQLKPNAVTGNKVKNGSIAAADLSSGALKAGRCLIIDGDSSHEDEALFNVG